ncbi:hypothetical protein ACJ73_09486, partial [Blastomyces percursus]
FSEDSGGLDSLRYQSPATTGRILSRCAAPSTAINTSAQPSPSPLRAATGLETQTPRQEEAVVPPPSTRRRIGSRARFSRSGRGCIVSKLAGPLYVAHIVPYSLKREDRRAAFFDLLTSFWTQRSASILKDGTELVENMLTFTPTVRRCHSAGLFALKPVDASHDGKSLKLKFYWLQQRESRSSTMVQVTDFPGFPDDVKLEDINMYATSLTRFSATLEDPSDLGHSEEEADGSLEERLGGWDDEASDRE